MDENRQKRNLNRSQMCVCRNVDKYAYDDMNNGMAHFTCSECGATLSSIMSDDGCILDGVYLIDSCGGGWGCVSVSYCPNCGAKVVG